MKKAVIDTRTLLEIWENFSFGEKKFFRKLIREEIKVSKVTIWHWVNGQTTPSSKDDRERVANILKENYNYNVSPETLFP